MRSLSSLKYVVDYTRDDIIHLFKYDKIPKIKKYTLKGNNDIITSMNNDRPKSFGFRYYGFCKLRYYCFYEEDYRIAFLPNIDLFTALKHIYANDQLGKANFSYYIDDSKDKAIGQYKFL